ncbi:MSMEG_0570 family nitrogen starvation response protein [Pseudokineococcus sp. 1T1Z-3]|uniref:MSMEG_0570 family nitrogen starvation response protein n=1 Tax=Pseudokineococcus sp. 1T1Z-3 TaxID=3132745 RepID=UPI0030994753
MPEARVRLRWPDGGEETCWSPSLVVHDHLTAGESYPVADVVARVRAAMDEADARVRARYGMACTGAAATAQGVAERAAGLRGEAATGLVEVLSVEPPLPGQPATAPGAAGGAA